MNKLNEKLNTISDYKNLEKKTKEKFESVERFIGENIMFNGFAKVPCLLGNLKVELIAYKGKLFFRDKDSLNHYGISWDYYEIEELVVLEEYLSNLLHEVSKEIISKASYINDFIQTIGV